MRGERRRRYGGVVIDEERVGADLREAFDQFVLVTDDTAFVVSCLLCPVRLEVSVASLRMLSSDGCLGMSVRHTSRALSRLCPA